MPFLYRNESERFKFDAIEVAKNDVKPRLKKGVP